ncbi:LacI family DNA-binding transcriptional regulator [Kaistia algarum]|uniref:LacI family DNA-binding transcriptional regulator n=1 Tax=Kaistia algarum TaxID=2083279 RepID=UPI002B1DCE62|nr:LacI family DNA-binding transcriptional regulator [Kaistia algarum]
MADPQAPPEPSSEPDDAVLPQRGLTLRMLGDRLGLSTATISLALRDSPLVAEATRDRVRAFAEEIGYVANRSAASLRTARTNMVGVVVHDVVNPYFAEIFRALEAALNAQSLAIMICNHADDVGRQRTFVETLMQHRADGLIMCPAAGTSESEVLRIVRTGLPFVMICRDVGDIGVPVVRGDDFAGGLALTRHLIAMGHRRIAFVGGRRLTSAGHERHAGYVEAHREAGLAVDPALDIAEAMTQRDGRDAAPALLALGPRPTAIFAFNDLVAFGLMSALRRARIEPGRDMAVAGYDDTDGAAWTTPSLTSVHNVPEEIGQRAAALLKDQIAGIAGRPERILIEPILRVRESTRPA